MGKIKLFFDKYLPDIFILTGWFLYLVEINQKCHDINLYLDSPGLKFLGNESCQNLTYQWDAIVLLFFFTLGMDIILRIIHKNIKRRKQPGIESAKPGYKWWKLALLYLFDAAMIAAIFISNRHPFDDLVSIKGMPYVYEYEKIIYLLIVLVGVHWMLQRLFIKNKQATRKL